MPKQKKVIFTLDRSSLEPMNVQLMRQIRAFLDSAPEGTRFPSERKIAEDLGINRVTIQAAMQPFVESGEMRRCGSKGTFVFPKESVTVPKPHPMQLEGLYSLRKMRTPLKLMLYEDYCFQREFWENCVGEFREAHPRISLEIIWVPQEYSNDTYGEYIAEEKPDLIQTFYHPMRSRLLAKLPKAFLNHLTPDLFCMEHLLQETDSLFDSLVPIYFSPVWEFMNPQIAKAHGLEILIPKFRKEGFRGVFPEVMEKAPHLVGSNTLWSYFSYAENRPQKDSHAAFRQISGLYDTAEHYLRRGIHFKPGVGDDPADQSELFAFGNYLTFRLNAGGRHGNWIMAMPPPGNGVKIHSGTSCLGIAKDSLKLPEALTFLEFMLSEKIQNLIPQKLYAFGFRRSSNLHYVGEGVIPEANFSEVLGATVSYYHYPFLFLPPYLGETRKYFEEYAAGQRTREDAETLSEVQYNAIYAECCKDFMVTNWHYFTM